MWRYQVFARKLTWYFIGVYIIKNGTQSGVHTKSGLEHISVIGKHLDKPQVQCKLLEQKLKKKKETLRWCSKQSFIEIKLLSTLNNILQPAMFEQRCQMISISALKQWWESVGTFCFRFVVIFLSTAAVYRLFGVHYFYLTNFWSFFSFKRNEFHFHNK